MIKTDEITINGKTFYKTYSDAGYLIHGGKPEGDYPEAIDPEPRAYTETTMLILTKEEYDGADENGYTSEDYEAAGRIIFGAEEVTEESKETDTATLEPGETEEDTPSTSGQTIRQKAREFKAIIEAVLSGGYEDE